MASVAGVALVAALAAFAVLPSASYRSSATLASSVGDVSGLLGSRQVAARVTALMQQAGGGRSDDWNPAEALAGVTVRPGAGGLVDLALSDRDPVRSARLVSAITKALATESEARAEAAARARDLANARRIDDLATAAQAAHRRLASLGEAAADPVTAMAQLADESRRAEARLASLKAIVAAGTPPLADRRDMPETIEALQADYLDRSHQLAKARETLGERHTTVIALVESTRRAAAALTAEWKRLQHIAEEDVATAHAREAKQKASIATGDGPAAAVRAAAAAADEALTRAQAEGRKSGSEALALRVVSSSQDPRAEGFDVLPRTAFSLLAGLLAGLVAALVAHLQPRRREAPPVADREIAAPRFFQDDIDIEPTPDRAEDAEDCMMMNNQPADGWTDAARLEAAVRAVVQRIREIDAGPVTTIALASTDETAPTAGLAIAIGMAAVEQGARVLLIDETPRNQHIAEAADPEAEPMLVDALGALRVVLPAEECDGLFLAPCFREGTRIAAALARNGQAALVDDLGSAFDLVLVDKGLAAATNPARREAMSDIDAWLRIAGRPSIAEDRHFIGAVEITEHDFLGTLTPRAFVAAVVKRERAAVWRQPPAEEPRPVPAAPRPQRAAAPRPVAWPAVATPRPGTRRAGLR